MRALLVAPPQRLVAPILALLAAAACALVIAPPLLAATGHAGEAALVRLSFAPVCHQNPERSFHMLGVPLSVCARCTGIYSGAMIAFVVAAFGTSLEAARRRAGAVLAAAAAPSLLLLILSAPGLIPDAAILRAVAGGILGLGTGVCLVPAFEALCAELALKPSTTGG